MVKFEEFLAGQEEVYSRLEDTSRIRLEGIRPSLKGKRSYAAVLRHPDYIAGPLEEFSRRISAKVPSVWYGRDNGHTRLAAYIIGEDLETDESVSRRLCNAVSKAHKKLRVPEINYINWMYSTDSVIVKGLPNETFLGIALEIMKNYGGGLSPAWGAHITANRFTEARRSEELLEFFELMQKAPVLGLSRPDTIDVIRHDVNKAGILFEVYERFKIL